jgi:DNA primase large subunit
VVAVDEGEIERIASALTRFLGPMARLIAKREAASARSATDLEERLSLRIADERERRLFLRSISKS